MDCKDVLEKLMHSLASNLSGFGQQIQYQHPQTPPAGMGLFRKQQALVAISINYSITI